MFKLKIIIISLLSIFIFSSASQAGVSGILVRKNSKLFLQVSASNQHLSIIPGNLDIENQINKLSPLDFISVEGVINSSQNYITIGYVNYVGLNAILGKWSGNDGYCYHFKGFTTLLTYIKDPNGTCRFNRQKLAHEFGYTVYPSSLNWLVMLSDDDTTFVTDLTILSKNKIEMRLYDSLSGDILKHIKLKK